MCKASSLFLRLRQDGGEMHVPWLSAGLIAAAGLLHAQPTARPSTASGEWPTYGGDLASSK